MPGLWLAYFIKGTNRHYFILNIYAVDLMIIDEKIFKVFPIVCLRAIDPQGHSQFAFKGKI